MILEPPPQPFVPDIGETDDQGNDTPTTDRREQGEQPQIVLPDGDSEGNDLGEQHEDQRHGPVGADTAVAHDHQHALAVAAAATERVEDVGQPIKMVLETTDVNHAFFIPAMRIKQDLLAGRTTEIRFTPTLAGDYPVLCAELCGSGHGDMRATIVVHPDEATFLTWFDPEVDALLNPPEDPVALGEQLLSAGPYPCAGCHTLETLGWTGNVGPNQNGIGDRASRREPGLTAEEYLFRSLYFPAEYLAPGFGALMPPFQANDPDGANYMPVDDARAIVAYLCTQTESSESACDLDNLASLTPES